MGEATETKSWWSSKTLWVNGLTAIVGLLTALNTEKGLDPQTVGYIATGLALANMVLRAITDKSLGTGGTK